MINDENNGILNTPPAAKSDTTDNSLYNNEYMLKNSNGNETTVKSMSLEQNLDDIRLGIGAARKEFKDGKINKEQKRKLIDDLKERRENSKRSLLSFATTKAVIDDHLENGNFNNSPSNMKYADFLGAIQANGEPDPNTGNKAIQGFDSKGNMMFSYVDGKGELIKDEYGNNISITSGQAKNLVTTVYDKGRTVIEEIGINSDKNGSTVAWSSNDDASTKHKVNTIVGNDVNNFNDLKAYPVRGVVGGQESTATLEGYLNGSELSASDLTDQMWSILSKDSSLLAKIGVEDQGPAGIDKGDFANVDNFKKLVDAVIHNDNPGFNLQTSKGVLSEFVNSQAKSLHENKWNASPLNKNSSSFVRTPGEAPPLTGNELTIQNMYKTDKGRQTINRFNTFTEIFAGDGTGQTNIDIESDGSGNILKSVKIDKTKGKILETTAKPGEEPVTNEISYNKLITLLTGNSGMSVSEATNLMGLDIKEVKEMFKTKRGDIKQTAAKSNLPDVMGKKEEYGIDVFDNHFTKQIKDKDFSITEPTDGNNMLEFTNSAGGKFKYYTFENDIVSGDAASQNMLLEAWVKSAKKLNK